MSDILVLGSGLAELSQAWKVFLGRPLAAASGVHGLPYDLTAEGGGAAFCLRIERGFGLLEFPQTEKGKGIAHLSSC